MAIFSKSVDSAQNNVTKAQGLVEEWKAKAAAARAEATRLDAESGALILADESKAEGISLQIQTLERKARAYDGAAGEAARKLHTAQLRALEAEAAEEDRLAAADRKRGEAHDVKVDALLAELKRIDGVDYTVARATEGYAADAGLLQIPTAHGIWQDVKRHEVRGAVIRYFISEGSLPNDFHDLNRVMGTTYSDLAASINSDDNFPSSVLAARDAGLIFEKVGV